MNVSLKTNYGGLSLDSPVIVSACPMSLNEQSRLDMQLAGAGAIILPSLFEEQVISWTMALGRHVTEREKGILAGSTRTRPSWAVDDAESYLALVNCASSTCSVPIIASLNGFSAGGWTDFAGELQEAGASAIELNVHPTRTRGYSGSSEIERTVLDSVREVKSAITIPLFVKLGRNFTSIPHLACQLLSGAQGIVLHGRGPTMDICLDNLKLTSRWKLTSPDDPCELLDTLMQVHSFCPAMPLAASGGICHADHLIKSLLSGADVAMVTSSLYREGIGVIGTLLEGLTAFMKHHSMKDLNDLQRRRPIEFSSEEERNTYITALSAHIHSGEN